MHLAFLFFSAVFLVVYPPALAIIAILWVASAEYQDSRRNRGTAKG